MDVFVRNILHKLTQANFKLIESVLSATSIDTLHQTQVSFGDDHDGSLQVVRHESLALIMEQVDDGWSCSTMYMSPKEET